jgi:hypothetical protein
LLPVVGERGRWLAAINPAWRYAAVDLGDPYSLRVAWEADAPGRAPLALVVRRRDPAAARRLIASTWRMESDAARKDLIGVLETGLSMADEPFLERALDDRDGIVRQRAAGLLAAIPGSRLMERMRANAGDILILSDSRLAPVFPARISDGLVRDGATRREDGGKPTAARTPADWSRLLIQTVGAIPLSHWDEKLDAPEAVVRGALAGKWSRTLITALATAALRQRDRRWIDALLEEDGYTERSGMLIAALDPADCFGRLAAKIAAREDDAVIVFLRRWPNEWDETCGTLLLDFIGRQSEREPETRAGPTLRFLSRSFANLCPPSLATYAAEALGRRRVNNAWAASLSHLARTLRLRQELAEAVERRPPTADR